MGYEVVAGRDVIDIVANGKKLRDFMDSWQDYYICNRKMCGKMCFEQCSVTTNVEYAMKDADGNPVRAKFGSDGEPYVITMLTEMRLYSERRITMDERLSNINASVDRRFEAEACVHVANYIKEHLDKSDPDAYFEVYVVWKCKILQNWKFLISSSLYDGMYYEVTYNGDKEEWYLDAYKKFENRCIKM